MLVETLVKSKQNGDVDITLTDPYSGRLLTLLTYPRDHILDVAALDNEGNKDTEEASSDLKEPQDF
jgi:hypothetical protein